jgi:hypothetical protein
LFIEFLKGNFDLECTPWGNPTFNIFGWQKPCYLIQEGYAATFRELMETTDWTAYGRASGNPRCGDCMVHCGHEPSAVNATFGSLKGFFATARASVFGSLPQRELGEMSVASMCGPPPGGPMIPLETEWNAPTDRRRHAS